MQEKIASRLQWSDVYGRSELGPGIWFDRDMDTPVPAGSVRLVSPRSRGWGGGRRTRTNALVTRFADGGTFYFNSSEFSERGQNGCWLVGWGALRYACLIQGIAAPVRRFKHEPFVPKPETLIRCVQESLGVTFPDDEQRPAGWAGERRVVLPSGKVGPGEWGHLAPRARWFWSRLADLEGWVPEPDLRVSGFESVCRI